MRTWQLMLTTLAVGCVLIVKQASPFFSSQTLDASFPVTAELGAAQQTGPATFKLSPPATTTARSPAAVGADVRGAVHASLPLPVQTTANTLPRAAASSAGSAPAANLTSPFIALGIVSNVMWQNSFDRRKWLRDTMLMHPNVGKTMHVKFVVALLQSDLSPIPAQMRSDLDQESAKHNDLLMLEKVPERKSPCLKTMAWYRWAVRAYPSATFIAKTDDDAYMHTVKLEHNMRRFAQKEHVYIGSTLWGSYITKTFEACARRMGPMMAMGGMREEKCVERGAIGPYPYAVGMLQVLSHKVATWMVAQPNFAEFERRATAATRPPMMDHGEDMVIGMFLYLSPWPLMPLHWGWDKLHDLCFECKRTDQIWRPISRLTVVAHHIANEKIIHEVHQNITRICDDACVHTDLPFEVESLEDLCYRAGGRIGKMYSKCKMVAKGLK